MAMTMAVREDRAIRRGQQLADRITKVAPGVYHCPSQSDPGGFHVVTDLAVVGVGQGLACTCTAAELGNPCAHRAALVVKRQQAARQQLSQRPVVARTPRKQVVLT